MEDYRRLSDIKLPWSDEGSYHEVRQRLRVQWLVNNSVGSVLELGCADGYIISQINHPNCCGVDFDRVRIESAKYKHPNIAFYIMDIRYGLPFGNNSFDTVLLPDILEHLYHSEAKKLFNSCFEICRDRVLITLPYGGVRTYAKELVETDEHKWIVTNELLEWLLDEHLVEKYFENGFVYLLVRKVRVIPAKKKLNLGCGGHYIKDAINIDIRRMEKVDIILDITKGLPYADGSVEKIMASHFIEHIIPTKVLIVLKDWHRVLVNGGKIEACIPDIELSFKMWQYKHWSYEELLGSLYGAEAIEEVPQQHKFGYTFDSLKGLFLEAGFSNVKRLDNKADIDSLKDRTREEIAKVFKEKDPSSFVVLEATK